MKVIFVVPSYPSAHCGVSTYSGYLVNELEKLIDVEILGTASPRSPLGLLKKGAIAVKHADIVHIQHSFDLYGYMGYLTFPLYRILHHAGKPIVTTIHELPDVRSKALKMRIAFPYLQRCITEIVQNSDAVIVHTRASLDLLAQWRLLKGVHLIPHGTLQPKTTACFDSPSRNGSTIGFFGFINEKKGLHRLLDALVCLPKTRLVIAGEPKTDSDKKYYMDLRSQATNLSIADRVEFMGYLPDSAMADFFRSADVIAFPYSICTASGALHLALAHGSVVLTSNLPVFHELKVRYDCLEEFDLEEPETLVAQLIKLLHNTTRRSELIVGCERMVQDTSWSQIARKTYAVYKSCFAQSIQQSDEPF